MASDEPSLISLSEVARSFGRKNGKRVRLETVHRWWKVGCRGRKLTVTRVGGRYYTTAQWLSEFGVVHNPPAAELEPRTNASREVAKAKSFLRGEGFYRANKTRTMPRLRKATGAGSGSVPTLLPSGPVCDPAQQND